MTIKHKKDDHPLLPVGKYLVRALSPKEVSAFYMHVAKIRAGIPIEPRRAEHFDEWKDLAKINGKLRVQE